MNIGWVWSCTKFALSKTRNTLWKTECLMQIATGIWSFGGNTTICVLALLSVEVELDSVMVQDFLSEVIVMRKFNHPNVMKLLGVTVHDDKPCIILPLMQMDLKQFLKQNMLVRMAMVENIMHEFDICTKTTTCFVCRRFQNTIFNHSHLELSMAWDIWPVWTLFIVIWLPETACRSSCLVSAFYILCMQIFLSDYDSFPSLIRIIFWNIWFWTVKRCGRQRVLQGWKHFSRIAGEVDESRITFKLDFHPQKWCGKKFSESFNSTIGSLFLFSLITNALVSVNCSTGLKHWFSWLLMLSHQTEQIASCVKTKRCEQGETGENLLWCFSVETKAQNIADIDEETPFLTFFSCEKFGLDDTVCHFALPLQFCRLFQQNCWIDWLQWSFGVLLWEIYTFGDFPYKGISDLALISHLKADNRLLEPPMLPENELWVVVLLLCVSCSAPEYFINICVGYYVPFCSDMIWCWRAGNGTLLQDQHSLT